MSEWIDGPPTTAGYYWAYYEDTYAHSTDTEGYPPFAQIIHVIDPQGTGVPWTSAGCLQPVSNYYKLNEFPDLIKHIKIEEPTI